MPKPIAWIVFLLLQLLFLPVSLLGGLLFLITYTLDRPSQGVSQTAYSPFFTRWQLHMLGKRPDAAAAQLIYGLPGVSRLPFNLMMWPTMLARRVTGVAFRPYDYPTHTSPTLMQAVAHRTSFFDQALAQHLAMVEQIVFLGAGWDTRTYNRAQRDGVLIFEVDAPQTQAVKMDALSKTGVGRATVVYVPADFNREPWFDALKRNGFDPAKPTFVLWEGVTYYLEAQAVEGTLQTVADQLAPGSLIAFDYLAEHIINEPPSPLYMAALKRVERLGEPWIFGISTEGDAHQQITDFLTQRGLSLERFEPIGPIDEQAHGGLVVARK